MKCLLLPVLVASTSLLPSIALSHNDETLVGRARLLPSRVLQERTESGSAGASPSHTRAISFAAPEQGGSGAEIDQAALDKKLAQDLSNSRLSGFSMIEGQQGPPQPDEYRLGAVSKQPDGKWLIHARIAYGQKSVNVPLEIPIVWAGDTPVISVTDMTIPGMGTYTARVMIYGDHYAGTWSSPRHGGYLWGRITHVPATQQEPGNGNHKTGP